MSSVAPGATGQLVERFREVRGRSVSLCAPLAVEDHVVQPIVDVSPPKWHLGHTAWFFEALLLEPHLPDYRRFHERYGFVFNSYYETVGRRVARPERGHLSRPTVADVLAYRAHVDEGMTRLLAMPLPDDVLALIELGLQHEQQHQELLLTDIKYILGRNPLAPEYDPPRVSGVPVDDEHAAEAPARAPWVDVDGGIVAVGHQGGGFAFDNEGPRHDVLVPPTAIRTALVTNAEYLAFMADRGYERFALWHSDGWYWLQSHARRAPLYWEADADSPTGWRHFTLRGLEPVLADSPVTHVSLYEAHAFCEWAGWRLPTEFEWETAADRLPHGRRWEWTGSAYLPYPGFRPAAGAVGEYNGKFMMSQMVLRGSSFATPPGHARVTYRNFFQPPLQWQYTGIRPARNR
ncbi:MAG: ergothioneine biosynthesis protein EgtB [Vicinamibacterales bacterium]